MDDVAVPNDVVLALEAQLAGFAVPPARMLDEVVVGHHLSTDEAPLDVAGICPAALRAPVPWRMATRSTRPRRREEADQVEQRVAGADEAIARALAQPESARNAARSPCRLATRPRPAPRRHRVAAGGAHGRGPRPGAARRRPTRGRWFTSSGRSDRTRSPRAASLPWAQIENRSVSGLEMLLSRPSNASSRSCPSPCDTAPASPPAPGRRARARCRTP
jgi:hypothetical protein